MNLCTCSKRIAAIFPFLTNPALLWALKDAKIQASFVHDRVRRGVGLFLTWRHNLLCMHVYKDDVDTLPFWLGREQKMLGFLQLSKPIKWQDLLQKWKNGGNAFRTGAKIHFSEKNILGLGALSSLQWEHFFQVLKLVWATLIEHSMDLRLLSRNILAPFFSR